MICHEECRTIEPLLVNSECVPKQLNQNLPFETDENTKASSFKHNWLVDIHLKQLIGMPCMLFPADANLWQPHKILQNPIFCIE